MTNQQKMPLQNSDRVVVTFREVALHFSSTDWECLDVGQRELYMDVMKDVHNALISLGHEIVNSQVFIRLKMEEEENGQDHQDMGQEGSCRIPSTSSPAIAPDVILIIKKENEVCDWEAYGEETSKIESAALLNTSVSMVAMKDEKPCSEEQDMDCRRVKQEEISTWECLTLARGHIKADASLEDLCVDYGSSTQAVSTLRDPDTARGGGTVKEKNADIACDDYEAGGVCKPVSGVSSPVFKQHIFLQEKKLSHHTDSMNKSGESFDLPNVKEDTVLDSTSFQNKRKLNSDGESESSIMHKRKSSKEFKREEQDFSSSRADSMQVTGTAILQDLRVNPSKDPSNVFTHSLSGHKQWKRTLEDISSDSNGSELVFRLHATESGRNRNDIHHNSGISATEEAADGSSKSALLHKNWSNTLDEVAEHSGQAVLWQNEQAGMLDEASKGSNKTVPSNDVWTYTSDEGALDSETECSKMTWGTGKEISSRKTIPHSVETLPAHDKSFLMIEPDASIKDFLSDLREDQRQTIRSFMKILLNVIDQESMTTHSVSPLVLSQSRTIQLQSVPPPSTQPPSVQIKSDQDKSINLHSSLKSAQSHSSQLRTDQSHSVQSHPSGCETFQSCGVQPTLCQRQPIQLQSIQSIQSQAVQPKPISSQSAQLASVHPRPVHPHSLYTESSSLFSIQSRPVKPSTIHLGAVQPNSIQLQTVQPLTGQSWSAQPHSMGSQSTSAVVVPPQCFPPRPIQSPPLCNTSLLQGSTTSEKIPLLVDPTVPARFSSVTVDKQHLRRLLIAAEGRVKKQAAFLLNGLIKLLFKKEELACSDGLGLRGKKNNSLDQVKVDAMREFLHSKCVERKWNQLDGNRFTRIITNKISNARRDLKQGNKGLKALLDTIGPPHANTRLEKNTHCLLTSAVHPLSPLQIFDNKQGQSERTLIKESVSIDSDSEDCILTS